MTKDEAVLCGVAVNNIVKVAKNPKLGVGKNGDVIKGGVEPHVGICSNLRRKKAAQIRFNCTSVRFTLDFEVL